MTDYQQYLPHGCQRAIGLPPEMELRVRRAGDQASAVDKQRVREQLTLGRAAASDLIVDDPWVNLIHARVVTGVGGGWELRCVGGGRLTLPDGDVVDRLNLAPGVSFRVGETVVDCVDARDGGDVKSQKANVKCEEAGGGGAGTAPAAVEMPRLVVCPTCYRDMTGVPSVARFCPHCGSQLPPRDASGFLIPPEESSPLFPVYKALRDELETKLGDESPQAATGLIILAYANALLNLGWRYEHGRGLMRNVEEAARCYAKAGKLSEAWGKGA
jgi:hypothetical protein